MNLLKLSCPACGGSLEIPGDLPVAHCVYCGTKILMDQDAAAREKVQRANYLELCEVAVKAGNHAEVIRYCNQILETDPRNVKAWINKATSTFWLATAAGNTCSEAMRYLDRASELAPTDERIATARTTIAWGLRHIGSGHFRRCQSVGPGPQADAEFNQAVAYYLSASDYAPDSIPILEELASVVKWAGKTDIRFEKARRKLETLPPLRAKASAQKRLPELRDELEQAIQELERLRDRSGFLVSAKRTGFEARISKLRTAIAAAEKDATYELPTT